jgi:hypothetical protein
MIEIEGAAFAWDGVLGGILELGFCRIPGSYSE